MSFKRQKREVNEGFRKQIDLLGKDIWNQVC